MLYTTEFCHMQVKANVTLFHMESLLFFCIHLLLLCDCVCFLLDVQGKSDNVKEKVTDDMLDELVDVYLSETDTISLLDIPSVFVSADDDNAEAFK